MKREHIVPNVHFFFFIYFLATAHEWKKYSLKYEKDKRYTHKTEKKTETKKETLTFTFRINQKESERKSPKMQDHIQKASRMKMRNCLIRQ
jgi:hypothetical protein